MCQACVSAKRSQMRRAPKCGPFRPFPSESSTARAASGSSATGPNLVVEGCLGVAMNRDGQWTSRMFRVSFLALIGGALFLASCSQRQIVQEEPNFSPTPGKTYTAQKIESMESIQLDSTFFEYDKWDLLPNAKKVLKKHAAWMRQHPDASVQIEGHCDERGSYEYNIALGEKRAFAAQKYLMQLGIEESRLQAVSRGKVAGLAPSKMAKNRKAVFIVFYQK